VRAAQGTLVKKPAFRYVLTCGQPHPAAGARSGRRSPSSRLPASTREQTARGDIMEAQHTVLIIDDNEEVLAALCDYFSQKGFTAISATNGLDGLKLLESGEHQFDLIVTDLVMPTISGVGIISIVKKKRPGIPIIAITGWGEHLENLASEANADYILEKPFELSDLEDVLNKVL
jgi:CheY-like chemotaxis protein